MLLFSRFQSAISDIEKSIATEQGRANKVVSTRTTS